MTIKSPSSSRATNLLYDVEDKVPLKQRIPLAIQNVFAMLVATITVPILVNQAFGYEAIPIPVALVTSGIGTLIYQLCTKNKSPIYLGSSFAFISPIILAHQTAGLGGAMSGIIAVGIVYVICALIIMRIGTGWIRRILPPIVIGPMILIIGLGLAPFAISQMGLDGSEMGWKNLFVVVVTLGTAIIVMVRGKGFLGVVPFLVAIAHGYVWSLLFGLVDLNPIMAAAWFSVPHFHVAFVGYTLTLSTVVQVAPVALVTMSEHIGDHESMSAIIGRNLLENPGLAFTLLGDGLATLVAALLGGPPNTSYGENQAVAGITKVASVQVLRWAAFFAIGVGFIGKFNAILSTIPGCVLGSVSLILYGFIALNGAKVWVENRIDFTVKRNIVITSIMLCLGLGGAVLPLFKGIITFSGVSLAAIVGVGLNLALPKDMGEIRKRRERAQDNLLLQTLKSDPSLLKRVQESVDPEAWKETEKIA